MLYQRRIKAYGHLREQGRLVSIPLNADLGLAAALGRAGSHLDGTTVGPEPCDGSHSLNGIHRGLGTVRSSKTPARKLRKTRAGRACALAWAAADCPLAWVFPKLARQSRRASP